MKGTDVRAAGNKVSFKAWPDTLLPLVLKGPILPEPLPTLRPMVSHPHSVGFAMWAPRRTEAEMGCIKHTAILENAAGWDSPNPTSTSSPGFLLGASKDTRLKRKHRFSKLPQAASNQEPFILPAYWYLNLLWCFLFPFISALEKK